MSAGAHSRSANGSGHVRRDAAQVKRFWRVMQGFSQEDRSKFIRYCWGRSRLPKPSSWPPNTPFKLTKHNGDDRMLPLSHTWCVHAPFVHAHARTCSTPRPS